MYILRNAGGRGAMIVSLGIPKPKLDEALKKVSKRFEIKVMVKLLFDYKSF
jgi:hypothetical protein